MRFLVAFATTVVAVAFAAPPVAAQSTSSFVRLTGYEGVGEQVFTDANASLFRTVGSHGSPYGPPQPDLFFSIFQADPFNRWQFTFVPPLGAPLVPGTYADAGGFSAFPLRPVMQVLHSTNTGLFVCDGGSFTINSVGNVQGGEFVEFDVEWTQECAGAAVSGRAVFAPPRDTVPPSIEVPEAGRVFRLATSPSGTIVQYGVTARDGVDPSPEVSCVPSSGSEFAIGETLVTCTATDEAANSSTATFTVFVIGAEGQLIGFLDRLASEPGAPGTSLVTKIEHALHSVQQGEPENACPDLNAFEHQVRGLDDHLSHAAELLDDAHRISAVLAC